jgi:signal transduction histidine kinase
VNAALALLVEQHVPSGIDPVERNVGDLSALVIPLRAHLAQAGGLVAIFDPGTPLSMEDRELLASFADQAGLALDRAQAVVDREEHAVIFDRERIARDLHDVVIQRLFATGLKLQGAASQATDPAIESRLENAVDDLDVTIKAIRGTIFELQHRGSDSLRSEIRGLVREYVSVLGFSPTVLTSGPVDTAVPAHVREELLPVLREAVSNVARHAQADWAQIEVQATDQEVRLSVADDGVGLSEDRTESGLRNVRRRAADLGGSVELTPGDPGGTVLVWRVPLGSSSHAPDTVDGRPPIG